MSCEHYYGRKKDFLEVGLKQAGNQQSDPLNSLDDKALLNYLMSQEKMAEKSQAVSFESPTSD